MRPTDGWLEFRETYGITLFCPKPGIDGAHEGGGVEGDDFDDGLAADDLIRQCVRIFHHRTASIGQ